MAEPKRQLAGLVGRENVLDDRLILEDYRPGDDGDRHLGNAQM